MTNKRKSVSRAIPERFSATRYNQARVGSRRLMPTLQTALRNGVIVRLSTNPRYRWRLRSD
jgi:hypothetical protein